MKSRFAETTKLRLREFMELDENGDGTIEKHEWLSNMLVAMHECDPQSIQLIMRKFREMDTDRDGRLDVAQFAAAGGGERKFSL